MVEEKQYTKEELLNKLTEKEKNFCHEYVVKDGEVWKDIEGYEGFYKISTFGNVKSINRIVSHKTTLKTTKKGVVKNIQINKYGYNTITLCKNSKQKTYLVHRLVALAYLHNIDNLPQINHINGIKSDNRVINLEYTTAKQNTSHAIELGLRNNKGINNGNSRIDKKTANEIRNLYSTGNYKIIELAEMFNISKSLVSLIKRGEIWN